jgi:hypothetical protein
MALAAVGVAAPARAQAFALTRLELVFANGRGEITVPLRYPQFHAFGMLRFTGTGVLQGTWKVDGRILGQVTEPTLFNEDLIITTPVLPTFEPGLHRVTLEVRRPAPTFRLPTITYFVTAEDYEDFRKRMEQMR